MTQTPTNQLFKTASHLLHQSGHQDWLGWNLHCCFKSSCEQKFPQRTREKIYHVPINVKERHCLIFPAQNKQYPL